MQRFWEGMSAICGRCWGLPLAALLGWGVLVGLMLAAHWWSWMIEYTLWSSVLEWLMVALACLVLLLWLGLAGWLLVRTVLGVKLRMWGHVVGCWACSMMSGGLALLIGLGLMILTAFFPDRFAYGLTLPEGREFVSPRGLRELQGDVKPASDRARELLSSRAAFASGDSAAAAESGETVGRGSGYFAGVCAALPVCRVGESSF